MRLWGWRPSSPPPKFINDVSFTTPLEGHAFDRVLAEKMNAVEFDIVCGLHEQVWGAPIIGPRRTEELTGLRGILS
jgi:hypothetical protein